MSLVCREKHSDCNALLCIKDCRKPSVSCKPCEQEGAKEWKPQMAVHACKPDDVSQQSQRPRPHTL